MMVNGNRIGFSKSSIDLLVGETSVDVKILQLCLLIHLIGNQLHNVLYPWLYITTFLMNVRRLVFASSAFMNRRVCLYQACRCACCGAYKAWCRCGEWKSYWFLKVVYWHADWWDISRRRNKIHSVMERIAKSEKKKHGTEADINEGREDCWGHAR